MRELQRYKAGFQPEDVTVEKKETLFHGFFKLVKYTFRHRLFSGGWSTSIQREMLERGDASALLAYDPVSDEVVLIEQIRVGALEKHSPWQLEIIAGMNDEGELPQDVVIREAKEEAGIDVEKVQHFMRYYSSSGGTSEMLELFVGQVDSSQVGGVYGLAEEGEDIKVHVMSREEAYQLIDNGIIENASTIIALQWLQLHYLKLKQDWLES